MKRRPRCRSSRREARRPAHAAKSVRTWQIYRQGFWTFLGLTALARGSVPLRATDHRRGRHANRPQPPHRARRPVQFRHAHGEPLRVAALHRRASKSSPRKSRQGRSPVLVEIIPPALKAWPRVAGLCVFVYGVFFLLTLFGFAILLLVATGTPSLALVFVTLGPAVSCRFVMFGRAFVKFLYWQQPAVLEETGLLESLKRSKELARSRRELPWSAAAVMARFIPSASIWFPLRLRPQRRRGMVEPDLLLSDPSRRCTIRKRSCKR